MLYAFIDEAGRITSAHNDDTVSELPEGAVALSDAQFETRFDLRYSGGEFIVDPLEPPVPDPSVIAAGKVAVVQKFMDDEARKLNYDDIATAVTYADEPAVPKFQAEGQAFRAWRSLVWATCYQILDDVNAGNRAIPEDAELIAALPALEIPASS
ncbi:hypothetical protein AB7813_08415 [Tardiphaga sp. 20_F10_N6_6]|uniref:hypothetical protein n=1 Tax=Tardiphaga sp. 20_F10_N6_6 TaxID=3240788 RepID=UPI003F8A1626